MKRTLPILLVTLFLCGCAAGNTPETTKAPDTTEAPALTYRQISMDEAAILMQETSDLILLDVRTPEEFAEKHIAGAINIPNEVIGTDEIPSLPDKDALILVYCRSGRRSKEAAEKLVALGYTNIVEIGGILDWQGATESGAGQE